jgi:glycosyltransferase involved in cell wall biosynthesis
MKDRADPIRVAVIAAGAGAAQGGSRTLARLRESELAGYKLELVMMETLSERRYDLIHVHSPGAVASAALEVARAIGVPVASSYHPDLRMSHLYAQSNVVLSPSRAADAGLRRHGVAPERIIRWEPGVDRERFNPGCYAPEILPTGFNVMYAGHLAREERIGMLADAFLLARDRDPRLHLVLAGGGPEEGALRTALGAHATFLGWLEEPALAHVYASADLLAFPSARDTFAHTIPEAQASGLPVLAAGDGGPAELVEDGRSGCLVSPDAEGFAAAIRGLARRPAIRDRLTTGGLLSVRERSWERSLAQLAAGYDAAITDRVAEVSRAA